MHVRGAVKLGDKKRHRKFYNSTYLQNKCFNKTGFVLPYHSSPFILFVATQLLKIMISANVFHLNLNFVHSLELCCYFLGYFFLFLLTLSL